MTRTILSTLVALLVTLASSAGLAEAQDAVVLGAPVTALEPVEPYEEPTVHRADRGLVIGGAVVLSIGWGLNTMGAALGEAGVAYNSEDGNEGWEARYALSFVPVLGPVIWGGWVLGESEHNLELALFAFGDALVQGAGLAMLIAGLVGSEEPIGEVAEGVRVLPIASGAGSGVMVDVRF